MTVGGGIAALLVVAGGALLLLALLGARRLIELLPMAQERRDLVGRASPILGVVLFLLYALFGVGLLLGEKPDASAVAASVLLLLVIAAAWPALRDVASGVALKTGRVCRIGDYVRVDGIQGRVQRLGLRTLTIETSDGDEAVVPYGRVVRETLFRAPAREHAAHHVFRVRLLEGRSLREAKEAIRVTALHVHWHSVVRDPQTAVVGEGVVEVTVFPIHPDRGPDVEAAVRAVVEAPPPVEARPKAARAAAEGTATKAS